MKVIIPIGGGDIETKSTLAIDKFIISLVNKKNIKVLFIPIASGDNPSYIAKFNDYYSNLNCFVDVLYLSNTTNDNLIKSKIFTSDIIYIGGGNTSKTMRIFKRNNVNKYLFDAYENGIILTGLSAGAMIYFQSGYSDANRSTNPLNPLSYLKCLDFIPFCFCPHYNEKERKTFDNFVQEKDLLGLALDDNCALVYIDNQIQGIIRNNENSNGYLINKNKKEKIPLYKE